MRRLLTTAALSCLAFVSACQGSGEVVYTGANEDAIEGTWIKDPEARGATRDSSGRNDTTRTESNRVDIPMGEFAQLGCRYEGAATTRHQGLDARLGRDGYAASRRGDAYFSWVVLQGFSRTATSAFLETDAGETLYPAVYGDEQLNRRMGRDRTQAFSGEAQSWADSGKLDSEATSGNTWLNAHKGHEFLEAGRTRDYLVAGQATRIVGLHLWKYANRDLVADAVEVTYTIVYYNTNEYDTGPTEIDEPVPFYTEYIANSATLPREGTSVEYLKRDNARDILRWKFPKGIKAGESSKMTYRVRVNLSTPYENRPEDHQPASGSRRQ